MRKAGLKRDPEKKGKMKGKSILEGIMRHARAKSPWILHLDTGGCLPGDTELITDKGEFIKMKDLADIYVPYNPNKLIQTGLIDKNILSVGSLEGKMQRASFAHRVKAPPELVEIETSTGKTLCLTDDHDVLVDTKKGQEWVEAGKIKKGDFLVSVRDIKIKEELPLIVDCLPGHILAYMPDNLKKQLKNMLIKNHHSIRKASQKLKIDYNRLVSSYKAMEIREIHTIADDLGIDWKFISKKIKKISYKGFKCTFYKKYPDERLMYALGLLASDGCITVKKDNKHSTNKISFSNMEKRLVEEFLKCINAWFPENKVLSDKNPTTKGLITVYLYSLVGVSIAKTLGLKINRKTSSNMRPIFRLPEKLISSFLAGYFDGDGDISIRNPEGRKTARSCLAITTIDKDAADVLNLLLKRVSVASRIDKTWNRSSFGEKTLYRIRISNCHDIKEFVTKIPFKHPKKIVLCEILKSELFNKKWEQSSINSAPLNSLGLLERIRKKHRLSLYDFYGNRDLSNIYKMRKRRATKYILKEYLSNVKKKVHNDELIKQLEGYVSQSYYLDPVKRITRIKNIEPWVYNVTVEESHSYIPNGHVVVKNCNGCSIETFALLSPRFDIERFGGLSKANPRHTDILVIDGAMTRKIASRVKRIYEQTPGPKAVVAVGSCAITKGIFHDAYNICGPLDKIIPVDVYVPGCPPKPEAIIQGIIKAIEVWKRK